MKKKIIKILLIIIKVIAAPIIWIVGFNITSDLFSYSFIVSESIILLICGLILCNSNWTQALFTWSLSVLFFSLILMPLIIKIPDSFPEEFFYYIGAVAVILVYILAYAIPTLISTCVVMLVYKFIQKKRTAKKLDTSED